MQALHDNFFYHSTSRLGADGLGDERRLLVEEQKLCRARARKFSLETNRRKKVLEDRRVQWDVQEQRLRENVLQQRRLRVQEATERFQRAHLPPSQRRRQSFRRNVPNIEDALNQIQGNLSSYGQQSSFLSNNSNVSSSCTPSPKPPSVSKASYRKALSAVEAYTKLLQDQSATDYTHSQEPDKTQGKTQQHSPRDGHLSDCCNSDSLSSKDSLENEDPNHSTKNKSTKDLQSSFSSFFLDSEKPHTDSRKQNDFYPTSSNVSSVSAMLQLGDNLPPTGKLHELKQDTQVDTERPNNKTHVPKSSWGFTSDEEKPKTASQRTHQNNNLLTFCEKVIGADPKHFELNSPRDSSGDVTIVTNKVTTGNPALHQFVCPKQEALVQKFQDGRPLKHPSATEILVPSKNGKDIFLALPPKPNMVLNDSTADNASHKATLPQTGKEIHHMSSPKDQSASTNNLNKTLNFEPKNEKTINTAFLQHTCFTADIKKCLKTPEEDVQQLPVSMEKSRPVCEVRFIKGILKKHSKYMSGGDNARVYGSGDVVFAQQVALAIRDSVELTRAKTKAVEGNSNRVKKKLRWFDEVENNAEKHNVTSPSKSKYSNMSHMSNLNNILEDHQLCLATVSGASKPGPKTTPPAPTRGYPLTKQAWADVGVQVNLPLDRTEGVKKARRKIIAGRKGSVIRPQSASEVGQLGSRTQGRMMVPKPPPPRIQENTHFIPMATHGNMDHHHHASASSVNCKQALVLEQTTQHTHKDHLESVFFVPRANTHTHNVHAHTQNGQAHTQNGQAHTQNVHAHTQSVHAHTQNVHTNTLQHATAIRTDSGVVYTPLPPPQPTYTCNIVSEGNNTKGQREVEVSSSRRRRGMVLCSEKGLCLECTPTDEEISQLWHGVRSALATKDAKIAFRRQALESGRAGRKTEPSKQPHLQPAKQTSETVRPISSIYNVVFPDEGLESAAQLHRAEVHDDECLLDERGVVVAMDTAQTQRPTNISLEEQKLLLSLDRLNHQLYCVREHSGGNAAGTRGLVLFDAPSTREAKVPNHHKNRATSASNRPRQQRKF